MMHESGRGRRHHHAADQTALRRRGKASIAAVAVALAFAAPTVAQAQTPRGGRTPAATAVVSCDFQAWSVDRNLLGLVVRLEPNEASAALARLPPPRVIGVDEVAVILTVTGYSKGWFRIGSAFFPAEADEALARQSVSWFRGEGWVPADSIKATLASDTLLAAPRRGAPVKATLRGTRGGFPLTPDSVAVKRLVSCQGTWVEAETEFGTGWVARVCGRQLSTC